MVCWVWFCLVYSEGLLADKEAHAKYLVELNGSVIKMSFDVDIINKHGVLRNKAVATYCVSICHDSLSAMFH